MTFLYALHYAIPVYATSSYLHQYFNSSVISATYVLGSLLTLFVSINLAKTLRKFHSYNFALGITLAEIVVIFLFGITDNPLLLPPLFIIHFILQSLLYISLNIFVESFSAHANVGSIRGLFLAVLHLGILISPLLGGIILANTSFAFLYAISALTLIPYLFLVHKYLTHIKEPAYHTINLLQAAQKTLKNKNIRAVVFSKFTVECFYATMVIYSPIYLATLGISLTSYMTFIIPIALIPLVFLPYELGILADKKYGEKEMLIIGLLILTVTTFLFVLITSKELAVWATILFLSRIGASLVDTMSFSYFFKKIGPEDPSYTALFVNMYAVSTVVIGVIGVIVSPFLIQRPQLIFVILGCIIAWSITQVLPMKDTR
jgi:MFS family permease